MRASRLRRAPLTPSSGDTTYPVPSIQVTAQEQDMNAPPSIDPVTAHSDSDVVHNALLAPERLEEVLASVLYRRQERTERRREHIAESNKRAAEADLRLKRL